MSLRFTEYEFILELVKQSLPVLGNITPTNYNSVTRTTTV